MLLGFIRTGSVLALCEIFRWLEELALLLFSGSTVGDLFVSGGCFKIGIRERLNKIPLSTFALGGVYGTEYGVVLCLMEESCGFDQNALTFETTGFV